MRPTRMFTGLVAALALGYALTGCGGDPDSKPTLDIPDSSAPTSATPSATASSAVFDDKGHDLLLGTINTSSARAKAAADVWVAYWQLRTRAYATAAVDPSALGRLASGSAAKDIIDYVAHLKSSNLHTEGDSKLGVSKVTVTSDGGAVLASCLLDKSSDRHPDGSSAEKPQLYNTLAGVLTRKGDRLVVDSIVYSAARCRA